MESPWHIVIKKLKEIIKFQIHLALDLIIMTNIKDQLQVLKLVKLKEEINQVVQDLGQVHTINIIKVKMLLLLNLEVVKGKDLEDLKLQVLVLMT